MRGFDDIAVDRERVALVRVCSRSRKDQGRVNRIACHNRIDLSQTGDHLKLDALNAFDVWNIVALTGEDDPTPGGKFVVESVEYDSIAAIVPGNLDGARDGFVDESEPFALAKDQRPSQILRDVLVGVSSSPILCRCETRGFAA